MDIKDRRRVAVGDHLTLLFENRDTMIYQVQEMMRAEKISDIRAISKEIEVYNELVPARNELTATLLIEYQAPEERDAALRKLIGLEDHVRMEVESTGTSRARFDTRQLSADRISSVHYLKFDLAAGMVNAIKAGQTPTIVVDHPAMTVSTRLTQEQTAALAEDLSAD
jgi:hypothetical protein